MKHRRPMVLATCVVLALAGSGLAQEQPQQTVRDFVSAVKASPLYEMARTFDVDVSQRAGEDWSRKLDVKVKLHTRDFLDAVEATQFLGPDGKVYRIRRLRNMGGQRVWELKLETPQEAQTHLVRAEDLRDLQFSYVRAFIAVDPANAKHETLSFDSVNVVRAIEQLCRLGDVDWAFGSGRRESKINLRLRNKSIVEALRFAAAAAGGTVTFERSGEAGTEEAGKDLAVGAQSSYPVEDMVLTVEEFWQQRRVTSPAPGGAMEAFGAEFSQQVHRMLKYRPVAVFHLGKGEYSQGLIVPLE